MDNAKVSHGCLQGVPRVFQDRCNGVSRVSQGCFEDICFEGIIRVFKECFNGVSMKFQWCFECVFLCLPKGSHHKKNGKIWEKFPNGGGGQRTPWDQFW